MSFKLITFFRVLLSLAGLVLASGHHFWYWGDDERRRRLFTALLVVVAAASLYFYLELGPQFRNVTPRQIMNPHDFYHYYVGAKYHDELGYFDLYECTVVADWETLERRGPRWNIRDLRNYRYHKAAELARSPENCRQQFTNERWREFQSDVRYFSRTMAAGSWELVLKDKGYNATPVWTAFVGTLTNLIPLRSAAGLYTLLSLDYLYTIGLLALVALTFGWRNGLFVAAFWGVNFMASTTFVKGSISRLDWLLCLVGALCLIRRGRYGTAGLLAGMATSLRLFPALFFVGLFFKFVGTAIRTRSLPRHYLRFGVVMLLTIGLLVGLTALTQSGRQDWKDFSVKIRGHDAQIAGYRVGFKYSVIDPNLGSLTHKAAQFEDRKPVYRTVIALVLALLAFAAQRVDAPRTLGLSFVAVFFLTAPTFYYYQMLVIPFMMFLPDRRRPGLAVGMSAFFAWSVLGYVLRLMWPLGGKLSYYLSWSLVALCALMLAQVFLVFREDGRADSEPAAV